MPLLVTYTNPEDQAAGLKALESGSVPYEVKQTDADGMDVAEVHVPEDRFDQACEIIERHEEAIAHERLEARKAVCPSCGGELLPCDDVDFSGSITGISYILKCAGCGRVIPR